MATQAAVPLIHAIVWPHPALSFLRQALHGLDERELHIIRNRFGLLGGKEQTLEEIGKGLNLSRERVRQLEREAKEKLRATLACHRANLRYSLA
jgi:DNA-directed RNA polymerase sigma subunit (sigma70/sigma32)